MKFNSRSKLCRQSDYWVWICSEWFCFNLLLRFVFSERAAGVTKRGQMTGWPPRRQKKQNCNIYNYPIRFPIQEYFCRHKFDLKKYEQQNIPKNKKNTCTLCWSIENNNRWTIRNFLPSKLRCRMCCQGCGNVVHFVRDFIFGAYVTQKNTYTKTK